MESQNLENDEYNADNVPQTSVEDVPKLKDDSSSSSSTPRERCKYGASCYRQNKDHKTQFSHPNDPDYSVMKPVSVTPDDADNRPECQYGTRCYRKNPQHNKDFKHTSLPKKKRRKKNVEKDTEPNQESSDDYDFDDPFINDGSSDDYQPTSSGSDSSSGDDEDIEEDTKRTLREGKKFVKR